jgi:hypothetical protein
MLNYWSQFHGRAFIPNSMFDQDAYSHLSYASVFDCLSNGAEIDVKSMNPSALRAYHDWCETDYYNGSSNIGISEDMRDRLDYNHDGVLMIKARNENYKFKPQESNGASFRFHPYQRNKIMYFLFYCIC